MIQMPRPKKSTELESRIASIISSAAREIASAVRADIADQVLGAIGGGGGRSVAPRLSRPVVSRGGAKRNIPAHCIYPGCAKPSKGPRFSFLCEEHMGISKGEKKQYLESWKAEHKPNGTGRTRGKGTKRRVKSTSRRGRRGAAAKGQSSAAG
jgi:hypothetical protein